MSRSKVYTLHFWPRLAHARHYTGSTPRPLFDRLREHALGRGARITQVQRERGGSWVLGRVEPGGRDRERQLKDQHRGDRHCDVCRAERQYQAGRITAAEALSRAGWSRASEHERGLLLDIFGLDAAPQDIPGSPPPHPILLPEPEPPVITPELEAVVDELIAGWTAQKAGPEPALHAEPADANQPAPGPEPEPVPFRAPPEPDRELELEAG